MYQAIFSRKLYKNNQGNPSREWKVLPCLCCEAAGGDYLWAEDICAAWFLFHNAARLMDNVEDNECSENELDVALSLNAATGLFFTAQYALHKLFNNPESIQAGDAINKIFISKLLKMSEGQYQDIINKTPNLENYWHIAEKKSGCFFSLATVSGARLATNDEQKLNGYNQYGNHLGLLVQLVDDLEDVYSWMHNSFTAKNLTKCLPFVYALEVSKETEKQQIMDLLNSSVDANLTKNDVINILNRNGAVLYLLAEIERHAELAIAGLDKVNALSPAAEKLKEIITSLTLAFKV